ncbi:MAG: hypothetical protein ACP5EN_09720 [Rhodovulum sp.]
MSDTASPREVDQVLSSIRRLVSDEAAGDGAAPAAPKPDRLLLTPALRVGGPTKARPAPASGAPAPAEATPGGHGADVPPETGRAPAGAKGEADEAGTLEQRIAELEAAVAGCDDDWEPDGADTLAAVTGWATPPRPRAAPADEATRPGDTAAGPRATDAVASSRPTVADAAPEDEADQMVLDEEMLRELVADIVREELQGRLGQRITLNVRKLVRREINRALAMRDLD